MIAENLIEGTYAGKPTPAHYELGPSGRIVMMVVKSDENDERCGS